MTHLNNCSCNAVPVCDSLSPWFIILENLTAHLLKTFPRILQYARFRHYVHMSPAVVSVFVVSSWSPPWEPQISQLVYNFIISSISTAVVQACYMSPQVAHVYTIAESRLSAIFALDDSARTCCCQGGIVIEWMSEGSVPLSQQTFLVSL
jgi:hypothetical protein